MILRRGRYWLTSTLVTVSPSGIARHGAGLLPGRVWRDIGSSRHREARRPVGKSTPRQAR